MCILGSSKLPEYDNRDKKTRFIETMTIEISDQIIEKTGLSPEKILLELAIILFQRESITLGQAGKIAGLHQIQFQKELAQRKIPIHYDVEDFEQDLETIKGL